MQTGCSKFARLTMAAVGGRNDGRTALFTQRKPPNWLYKQSKTRAQWVHRCKHRAGRSEFLGVALRLLLVLLPISFPHTPLTGCFHFDDGSRKV
ncbi:MAG: hypothetical protein ABI212_11590 [Burkholderiaceae bacterium]